MSTLPAGVGPEVFVTSAEFEWDDPGISKDWGVAEPSGITEGKSEEAAAYTEVISEGLTQGIAEEEER